MSAKGPIRRNALASRRALQPADLRRTADAVTAALAPLLTALPDGATVASYAPMAGEPRPPTVPARLRTLLPVLLPDRDLAWVDAADPLRTTLPPPVLADAALVLTPALLVDRRGVRLGRGGGSYDRALPRRSAGVLAVALLHDGELVEALPCEPHDARVDGVVTATDGLVLLTGPGSG